MWVRSCGLQGQVGQRVAGSVETILESSSMLSLMQEGPGVAVHMQGRAMSRGHPEGTITKA